jgi:hypothetical protein
MASINLNIAPIQGYTATERAEAISEELFAIGRPPQVRNTNDVSRYLFGWTTHQTTGACVLHADTSYVINVHPQNNLTNLIALMPKLHEVPEEHEKIVDYLVDLISTSQSITFGQLLTGNETIYTHQQLIDDGWFGDE